MGRRTRGAIAALLTLVLTGLGHAYLRRWRRAAGWLVAALSVAFVLTAMFLSPELTAELGAMPTEELMRTLVTELPAEVTLPMAVLRFLAAVDAYRIAVYSATGEGEDDGATCPNCRGELDGNLDFCPWCAEPLAERPREEPPVKQ